MSSVVKLISQLRKLDIKLHLDGGKLKINAPGGALTDDIKNQLRAQKDQIIEFLSQATQDGNDKSAIPLAERSANLPLSFQQHRLWALDQLQPHLAAYNMPLAVRLKGAIDINAFRQTFQLILQRHDILRVTFDSDEGVPFHVTHSEAADCMHYEEAALSASDSINHYIETVALEEASRPFDLACGPLLRARIIKLANQDHLLLVTTHHIVADGWSLDILLKEITTLYAASSAGLTPNLTGLPIQYVDFSTWQRNWLTTDEAKAQLAYWKKKLDKAPKLLALPTDRPRPPQQTFAGAMYNFSISAALTDKIKTLANQQNATLFMTLLSAFELLLARYSHQNDICVAIPHAGRDRPGTADLIGFFVNVMCLRGDLSGNCTVAQLIQRIRQSTLECFNYADIPQEMILDELKIERNPAYPPLTQVGFALQNTVSTAGKSVQQFGSLTLEPVNTENHTAKYEMILFVMEKDGGLSLSFEYKTDLFNEATMATLAQHYTSLLETMVANPNQPIDSIDLLEGEALYTELRLSHDDVEAIWPLTSTIKDLYLAHAVNPDTKINSFGQYVEFRCDIDPQLMQQTIQAMVDHSPTMRARLVPCSKAYAEVAYIAVYRERQALFEVTDLSDKHLTARQLNDYLHQHMYLSWDIHGKDLNRFDLIKVAGQHWVLLLSVNHVLFDGLAATSCLKHILDNYVARRDGGNERFIENRFQDYISLARQQFDSQENRQFWQQRLGVLEPLNYPVPPASQQAGRFISRHLTLNAQQWQPALVYCQSNDLSLPRFYKALYGILIRSYCRAEGDFHLRDTLAGRPKEQTETLGCYHRMVPFIFKEELFKADAPLSGLFAHTRNYVQEVKTNSEISLIAQRQLTPSGQLGFMYNFYSVDYWVPFGDEKVALELRGPIEVGGQVQLILEQVGDDLRMHLHYPASVFADLNFLERLQSLSEQIINGVQTIGDLSLTLPQEEQRLIEWNQTLAEYPDNQLIHQLIEQQVECTPDAVAVSYNGQQLSYRELNRQANQLAHFLRSLGVGPDIMVGAALERSTDMSIALLAILKAGGAYVPFDPSFPADRLGFMLEDTNVPVILTQSHLRDQLPESQARVLCLDSDNSQWADQGVENPAIQSDPDKLFNVIFTSGSTGKPKGVMVPHRGIVNRLHWMQRAYPLDATDRILQKTPYSFDVSVWELFWPLMYGAQIVYAKPEGHKDPDYLRDIIQQQQITTLHFVPSMLGIFLLVDGIEDCLSIRRVFCSGEALQLEHEKRFFDRLPDKELHNLYGPTEASVDVSWFACQPNSTYRSVPIGKPVDNTQLYILDDSLKQLPIGNAGELHIGGVQLARGYLKREELTASTFIASPFYAFDPVRHPSPRLYKTGDLARYKNDGNIEYIGRVDFQVKVRGLRIELGEIETLLHQHPDVKETIVVTKDFGFNRDGFNRDGFAKDGSGNVLIIAYLVPEDDHQIDATILRSYLAEHLPEYMIPNAFVALDEIPLSPNGKANRKALPDPDFEAAQQRNYVAPRNETEQTIATIWQDILGVEQVGIHDNFFELGGHSLLATRVVARLREALDVELAIRDFFEANTIAALMQRMSEGTHQRQLPAITSLDRNAIEPEQLALSYAQQRLWIIDQIDPGSPMYNIPFALRIQGNLNVDAMQKAFAIIVARHESLRTTLAQSGDKTYQQIHDADFCSLKTFDIDDDELSLQQRAVNFMMSSFDLQKGPLFKAELWRLSRSEQPDYALMINMHHIVSDGWSVNILLQEMVLLYQICYHGQSNPLPPLAVQYADFAQWQRQWLQGEVLDQQIAYWKTQLGNVPLLELPTDHPRAAVLDPQGRLYHFSIDKEVSQGLNRLSQQQGVTLFMTLLSAFQVLLHRYSGQGDISVGSPIANRTRQELEPIIGFFVNTLVLRSFINAEQGFTDLLEQVKQTTLTAYQNQDVSFERLVDELNVPRSLSHTPLFQVMFILQNTGDASAQPDIGNVVMGDDVVMGDLQVTPLFAEDSDEDRVTNAKFDLTLSISEHDEGLACELEYRSTLFERSTIERMMGHFQRLLQGIIDQPQQSVATLPLLSDSERHILLSDWNQTVSDYPKNKLLHELIEEQVELNPDSPAICFNNETLSYRQLNEAANQLARHIRAHQSATDKLIGVCLERSNQMIVALLAVLKSGCAYVPIDPEYPQERTEYVIESAGLDILITQQALLDQLPKQGVTLICLDSEAEKIKGYDSGNLSIRPQAVRPMAYTIYTSGSTGKPKGVAIPQQAFVNFLCAMTDSLGMDQHDILLAVTTLSFDIAGLELFVPLLLGGKVVIASRMDAMDHEALAALIRQQHITVLQATPATWHMLVNSDWQTPRPIKGLCGGEPLPPRLANQLIQRGVDVYNMYGPTETTVWSTVYHLPGPVEGSNVSIGRPIANTSLYILDKHHQPVPLGVSGELWIGGDGVALGYLGRDDLTAAAFIDNPFINDDPTGSERIYRTGDLARYLGDGRLECQGRIDNQVKVRGYRIELGEIETILNKHPAVREGVVQTSKGDGGNAILVGYVVVKNVVVKNVVTPQAGVQDDGPSVEVLQNHLRQSLPDYMVPGVFIFLDAMPLTPNGKVDRKSLPAADDSLQQRSEYVAPRTETETAIANSWAQVMGLTQVGATDNFFELGGHSLLATQMMARLRQQFQLEIPLKLLFEAPTVETLAHVIDNLEHKGLSIPDISPIDRDQPLPLSFNQQRLWFLQQLMPDSAAYNMPAALRISGTLDTDALRQSFQQLAIRHEILRTAFISDEQGQTHQHITAVTDWQLPIDDLRHLPGSEPDSEKNPHCQTLMQQEAATPFDLSHSPLLRTRLLHISDNEYVLLVTMHHIISDAWSLGVMLSDLSAFYQAAVSKRPAALTPLPVQYADYAWWQHHVLSGEILDAQLDYWTATLQGAPRLLNLPTDRPRPALQSGKGAYHRFTIDSELTALIRQFSQSHNLTPFMTMLAAYQLLLSRYTSQRDICVGVPIAGRAQRKLEGLIGYFVNALIVRTNLSDNPTVAQLIHDVRDGVLGAFNNQELPAERLIDALGVERSTAYNPIAQVGFNYQPDMSDAKRVRSEELSIELLESDEVTAKYDMIWTFNEADDRILAAIEYATDLFDAQTLQRMSGHFLQLLKQMLREIDKPVDSVMLLSGDALYSALHLDAQQYQNIYPLTAMQRDLIIDGMINPDNQRNYLGVIVDLKAQFHSDLWQQALDIVVNREPVLRTRFVSGDMPWLNVGYQAVLKADVPGSRVIAESITPAGDSDSDAFRHQVEALTYQPYQPGEALFRIKLFTFSGQHTGILTCANHALCDGIAVAGINYKIAEIYAALLQGTDLSALPEAASGPCFAQYIQYNRERFDTREVQQFWQEKSQQLEALSPYVSAEKAARPGHYVQIERHVEDAHWTEIKKFCLKKRTTPGLYFKALYSLALKTWCNTRENFYFNEIVTGRPKGHVLTLGCYFQSVPFIAETEQLQASHSIDQLLQTVSAYRAGIEDYENLSNAAQHRLFASGRVQVLYNFYGLSTAFNIAGQLAPGKLIIPRMQDSINFIGQQSEKGLDLILAYTDNVFDDQQLLDRILYLSRQIIDKGVATIGELQFVFPHEIRHLLAPQQEAQYAHTSLKQLLEAQMERTPDHVAVVCGANQLTYAELNRRANQLAHYLIDELKVGRSTAVGICMSAGIDFMVALLATVKTGAIYIPMDANYPRERLAYMLGDARIKVLLSEACLKERLPEHALTLYLDDGEGSVQMQLTSRSTDNPVVDISLDNMLYIIYTSGSTGRPKGAGVKQRGELNLLQWYTREFAMSANDRALIISALGFDLTQKNLFALLSVGGAVVFPATQGYDDQLIRQTIAEQQVTLLNSAPSAFYPMVENFPDYDELSSLRLVLFGGEAIRIEKLLPWLQTQNCRCQVVNMYGPTECTDIATYYRVERPDEFVSKPIPIGHANDGVQLYVCDHDHHLVPPGIPGELLIGGEGVGFGYFGKPDLTKAAFIDKPFTFGQDKPAGKLYRTGDLVRQNSDGELEFIGRIDFQVKLRGLRIELGEIEFALRQLEHVSDALSLVRNDTLLAYVTLENGAEIPADWRSTLADYLPDYMIPQALLGLEKWPLTPNGKIDRQALPDIGGSDRDYVAPRNDTEVTLEMIWAEVLGLEKVSIHDSFFDLGGHSLTATQIAGRIRQSFQIDLALRDLFECTTIAEIGKLIDNKIDLQELALPPIEKAPRDQPLPATYAQQRLWFLDQLIPDNAVYNMPMALRISGPLDIPLLQRCFDTIVQRHEVMRTTFIEDDNEPYLLIHEHKPFVLSFTDYTRQYDGSEHEQLAKRFATENALFHFDIESGPLFRAAVAKLADDNHLLVMNIHHIISDGDSLKVLFMELVQLYAAYKNGQPSPLPELTVQYTDYAYWQRSWLQGDVLDKQLSYWTEKLSGAPDLLRLPTDRLRPDIQTYKGAIHSLSVPTKLADTLREFSRLQGSTLFMTTLAAFQILLARHSGMRDICTGIPLVGRTMAEVEPLIGFFVNSLIIRNDFNGNPTLLDAVKRVRQSVLDAFAHEHVPIEMTLQTLGVERTLAYQPIAQTSFQLQSAMQNQGIADLVKDEFAGLSVEAVVSDEIIAKWDMTVTLVELPNGELGGSWEYNTDLFDASTIARMADHFLRILSLLVDTPEQSVDTFAITNDRELAALLGISLDDYEAIVPVTAMQRDLYLSSLTHPDTLENSVGYAYDIQMALDVGLWKQALQAVSDHFAILRADVKASETHFTDTAFFCIARHRPLVLSWQDLSNETCSEEDIHTLKYAFMNRTWDVRNDDLIQFGLFKIHDTRYVATLAFHHMLLDGISGEAHLWRVIEVYQALLQQQAVQLPEDNARQFIAGNRQQFDSADVISFWRQQLKNATALQFHRGSAEQGQWRKKHLVLADEQFSAIKKFCFRQRITPALYFKCLYGLLIRFYTQADGDVVVSEFGAGRTAEFKDTMACTYQVNPFPFSADPGADSATITDLFASAKQLQEESRNWQKLSIFALRQLMPQGGINFSYNFIDFLRQTVALFDREFDFQHVTPQAEGSVGFAVKNLQNQLNLFLDYHSGYFEDHQFLERILLLSDQLIAGKTQLSELKYVTNREGLELLSVAKGKFNGTAHELPAINCVQQLIEAQVEKTPQASAVICGSHTLTYQALNERANQLAHHLVEQGIAPQSRIGICLGRRVEVMVAILGVIKAGCIYVPMDANYPDERLKHILADSAAPLLICESCLSTRFTRLLEDSDTGTLDLDALDLSQQASSNPTLGCTPDDGIYMIYTSGSTGLPKGAGVLHRGEINLLDWYTREFDFSASDRTLIISAFGFDLTQKNLFALLTVGGTVVLPDVEHYDVERYLSSIAEHRITVINCAPSAFNPLLELAKERTQAINALNHLRVLLFGGEPIHLGPLADWINSPQFSTEIVNMYGPTECTDIATFHRIADARSLLAQDSDPAIPLGRPNDNVRVYLLNKNNQLVPPGLTGEVCIAGEGVGSGYHGLSDLTAEKFISNPFGDGKLYRTGDLACFTDASLQKLLYVGRMDFQVKVRGLRIELGEIEHAVRQIENVLDALILVKDDSILAFTVPGQDAIISPDWRAEIARHLPDYMLPSALISVAQWPLTPNGKIDREALLALDTGGSGEYVAPRNDIEKAIADIWRDELGKDKVGIHDNFFEMGGHSLLAVRLINRIERQFDIELPLASLFNAQTVAELAKLVSGDVTIDWSPLVPIKPAGTQAPLFIVHPIGAMVLCYEKLASRFEQNRPLIGIQARGFEPNQYAFDRLPDMAAFYVKSIRAQQANGPYYLAGHSIGGVVVWEMARQLIDAGEQVAFIGLLDSHLPNRALLKAMQGDANLLKMFVDINLGDIGLNIKDIKHLSRSELVAQAVQASNGVINERFLDNALNIMRGFQQMLMNYQAAPLPVNATLIRAEQETQSTLSRIGKALSVSSDSLGWEKLVKGRLNVRKVPGDHNGILREPFVDRLAQELSQAIKASE